ncbi:uncharacterized protein BO97DRAFT_428485 [Aspergillus homomorphus CBS 101889]|uniref:Nephrocystin 3-like N-terminal domain-containing protein n=1 Tax=Aspergillus homomorphus (strain CBS 101889) TaxID=1450537 RepID=A0A395HL67_ASPHC|nr:hypothetical protein BO97DRAFT_428485 [Aspergillus homomorphus CBS 101889]RAL08346.1 hypothetical protein BO97DRAFT_428485 [Aspergillus homomorphus CBS 101889]
MLRVNFGAAFVESRLEWAEEEEKKHRTSPDHHVESLAWYILTFPRAITEALQGLRRARDGVKTDATRGDYTFGKAPMHPVHPDSSYPSWLLDREYASQITLPSHAIGWVNKKSEADEMRKRMDTSRDAFQDWLSNEDQQFFHISGKPGSGKSKLVHDICIYDEVRTRLLFWSREKSLLFGRVFYKFNNTPNGSSYWTMIQGILWALIREDHHLACFLFPGKWDFLESAADRFPEYCRDEIFAAWCSLVRTDSIYEKRKIAICLDGWDKLKEDDQPQMIKALKAWVQARPQDVKICITSRGEKLFQEAFGSCPGFILHEVNYADMVAFVRKQVTDKRLVTEQLDKIATPDEQETLAHEIAQAADGSFLWLSKMVKEFVRGLESSSLSDQLTRSRLEQLKEEQAKCSEFYRNHPELDSDLGFNPCWGEDPYSWAGTTSEPM